MSVDGLLVKNIYNLFMLVVDYKIAEDNAMSGAMVFFTEVKHGRS